MSLIIDRLQHWSESRGDDTAIVGSNRSLSWRDLDGLVSFFTDRLQGTHAVGLHLQNSAAWIVCDLAATAAGVCSVPLPTFFSDEQLQHAVRDAAIDLVVTDNPDQMIGFVHVASAVTVSVCGAELSLLSVNHPRHNELHHCKITYTSGTTGTPKGVVLDQKSIETVVQSLSTASQASREDRALVVLPLSTLLENIASVYTPVLCGATVVVPDASETGIQGFGDVDINAFGRMLQRYRPSTIVVPPQLLKLLIGLAAQQQLPDSFRFIAVGGAPTGSALMEQASKLGMPVYEGYGLSEACSVVAANTPGANRRGSVGKPLPHARITFSDEGEVLVEGTLYRGYLNQPGVSPKQLASGDLGYLDEDGFLHITGRQKNVIITSYGRNVSPEWPESELLAFPEIAQAAVFGNDKSFLAAVLVASPMLAQACSNDAACMRAKLDPLLKLVNARLPDYARVTEYLIASEPFSAANGELTSNGRPRRDSIAAHYAGQIEQLYEDKHEQFL